VVHVITENTSLRRFNSAPTGLLTAQFIGRLKELEFLREVFSAAPNGVPIRCVVCGMPGVGKTSLVLRYAIEAFGQGWYSQVLWSSGTTVDKLNEGMVKILDLVGHPERHRTEQSAKLTAARRWLEDPQGGETIRWLLIIDNVGRKTLGFLREHLPCTNGKGHILFTTRTVDVADALVDVTGASHRKLEMSVPDMRDTARLLFSSAGIETDTVTSVGIQRAEKLIKTVGSLPLAIVHAASYMKQTQTSLEDMLELYQSQYKGEVRFDVMDVGGCSRSLLDAAVGERLDVVSGTIGDSHV
jgi:GTPase SAR1 family protein